MLNIDAFLVGARFDANDDGVSRAAGRDLHDGSLHRLELTAAEGALNGLQSVVEAIRLQIQNNRDVMLQELRTLSDLVVAKPQGTFYVLPDFRAYNADSIGLAQFLLRKALVVTVPGKSFGMEGHLRLSYCGSIKEIKEGIERIRWALDANAPNEIYIGDRKLVRDWL